MSPLGDGGRDRFGVRPLKESTFEFRCPACHRIFVQSTLDIPSSGMEIRCPACRLDFRRRLLPADPGSIVKACWLCGSADLYAKKDLNEPVAYLAVLAAFIASVLLALRVDVIVGVLCAIATSFLLVTVYGSISTCTVCYVCGTIYRGFPMSPEHAGHLLAIEDRMRDRKQAWLRSIARPPEGGHPSP